VRRFIERNLGVGAISRVSLRRRTFALEETVRLASAGRWADQSRQNLTLIQLAPAPIRQSRAELRPGDGVGDPRSRSRRAARPQQNDL
jgi:hypothetical protein